MYYSEEITSMVRAIIGHDPLSPSSSLGDFSIYKAFEVAVRDSQVNTEHNIDIVTVESAGVELSNTTALSNNLWMMFIWGTIAVLLGGWDMVNKGVRWRSGLATIDTSRAGNLSMERLEKALENYHNIIAMYNIYGDEVDLYSKLGDTVRIEVN